MGHKIRAVYVYINGL